jgi:mannose-6-phosphate isomerase-like protein (cupin superfamily)
MAEVFFILSGTGEIVIDNCITHIKQKDCRLVELSETHELRNTGNVDMTVVYFGIID